uniref:Retrotransposon protein, putative, Ty1-copia subclass n=1 Tax=Tanacetum cinerariifolium TaxID=118510 RepID=A0A699JZW5_TANCI|nr:hypothetical protein [Tanacetum cinerariifolium]
MWLIGLSQSAYIDKILKKYNMHNSKKGYLPMEVKHDLSNELCASTPEEVAYMKKVPYASANPGKLHWVAVKHILKYLRITRDMFLMYGGKPDTKLDVIGFYDASWHCDIDDTKSQTGYVFVINGGKVDWKSKKQTTIAMHLVQAEYIAASEAAMEAVWIREFVGDLGVMPSINKPINMKFMLGLGIVPTINKPIKMFCDNSAVLLIANEPGVQRGAMHYHRRYHYVRECIELSEINLLKVHTDDNLADPFTNALRKGKLTQHARSMGLRLASSFM